MHLKIIALHLKPYFKINILKCILITVKIVLKRIVNISKLIKSLTIHLKSVVTHLKIINYF